jgi:hypothetical protein
MGSRGCEFVRGARRVVVNGGMTRVGWWWDLWCIRARRVMRRTARGVRVGVVEMSTARPRGTLASARSIGRVAGDDARLVGWDSAQGVA